MYLIDYSTAYTIANISDEDFEMAVKWCEDHFSELTSGCYREMRGYKVSSCDNIVDMLEKTHETIILLYKDLSPDDFEPNSFLMQMVKQRRDKYSKVSIIIDTLPDQTRYYYVTKIKTLENCSSFKFYEVDFQSEPLKKMYADGVQIAIGNEWFIQKDLDTLPSKEYDSMNFDKFYKIEQNVDYTPPVDGLIKEMKEPPTLRNKTVFSKNGEKYSELDVPMIWKSLGLDRQEFTVLNVEYVDRYFTHPSCWKTFLLLLKDFKFASNATIDITSHHPKDNNFYELRGSYDTIYCSSPIRKEIREKDLPFFCDIIRDKLRPYHVKVVCRYVDELEHFRKMKLTCKFKDGHDEVISLILDKGSDFLDFREARDIPLFGQSEKYARYYGSSYFTLY